MTLRIAAFVFHNFDTRNQYTKKSHNQMIVNSHPGHPTLVFLLTSVIIYALLEDSISLTRDVLQLCNYDPSSAVAMDCSTVTSSHYKQSAMSRIRRNFLDNQIHTISNSPAYHAPLGSQVYQIPCLRDILASLSQNHSHFTFCISCILLACGLTLL